MTTLLPSDVGLPPKFATYRPGQVEAIMALVSSDKRFNLLDAPTGSGKTAIYVSVAMLLGLRVLILVGNKPLQQQIINDFREMGAVNIEGKGNYVCLELGPGRTCDIGPCNFGQQCSLREAGCHHFDARRLAFRSRVVVSNYAYAISMAKYGHFEGALGKFDMLVLDEAHTAPEWLVKMCRIKLNASVVQRYTGMRMPQAGEDIDAWSQWAAKAHGKCVESHDNARHRTGESAYRELKDINQLTGALSDIAIAAKEPDPEELYNTDWIIEREPSIVTITPLWGQEFAEKYLYRGIERVVLASATLTKGVSTRLGIAPRHSKTVTVPSIFNVERRLFIHVPTARLQWDTEPPEMNKWMNRIDEISGPRLDLGLKGIIPAVSYDRARGIKASSKYGRYMTVHDSRDTKRAIERFKRSNGPGILVSPVIFTGYDFPGDECRFIIVCKVPFISTQDPLSNARSKADKNYVYDVTSIDLTQTAGRGNRSADDWCEIICIDDNWFWFKNKGDFPDSFRESWRQQYSVPPPLNPGNIPDKPRLVHF